MRAYSTDLREKLVLAYESGSGTLDEVAEEFGVGRCTVARLLKLHRAGDGLTPKPHGGGYPAALDARLLRVLCRRIERRPDATLAELAEYLRTRSHVTVHPSTVCRALQRLGLPRKKKPRRRRTGRGGARGLPPRGRGVGSASPGLHRRDGLSFSHDALAWALAAWRARRRASATPARHCDAHRVA